MENETTAKEELMNMFFKGIRPLAESQYDIMLDTLGSDFPNTKGLVIYGMILQTLRQHCREDMIRRIIIREDGNISESQAEAVAKFVSVMVVARNLGVKDSEGFETYAQVLGFGIEDKPLQTSGEFGYDATNPIPVNGIPANDCYLSRLKTEDGKDVVYERIGSKTIISFEHPIDVYSISDESGLQLCTLHLYPYSSRTSGMAPKGFTIYK